MLHADCTDTEEEDTEDGTVEDTEEGAASSPDWAASGTGEAGNWSVHLVGPLGVRL